MDRTSVATTSNGNGETGLFNTSMFLYLRHLWVETKMLACTKRFASVTILWKTSHFAAQRRSLIKTRKEMSGPPFGDTKIYISKVQGSRVDQERIHLSPMVCTTQGHRSTRSDHFVLAATYLARVEEGREPSQSVRLFVQLVFVEVLKASAAVSQRNHQNRRKKPTKLSTTGVLVVSPRLSRLLRRLL